TAGRARTPSTRGSQIGPEHLAYRLVAERLIEALGLEVAGPDGEDELRGAFLARPRGAGLEERAAAAGAAARARDHQVLDVAAAALHHRRGRRRVVDLHPDEAAHRPAAVVGHQQRLPAAGLRVAHPIVDEARAIVVDAKEAGLKRRVQLVDLAPQREQRLAIGGARRTNAPRPSFSQGTPPRARARRRGARPACARRSRPRARARAPRWRAPTRW